jgi:hypothetical protein
MGAWLSALRWLAPGPRGCRHACPSLGCSARPAQPSPPASGAARSRLEAVPPPACCRRRRLQVGWLTSKVNRRMLLFAVVMLGQAPCLLTYWVGGARPAAAQPPAARAACGLACWGLPARRAGAWSSTASTRQRHAPPSQSTRPPARPPAPTAGRALLAVPRAAHPDRHLSGWLLPSGLLPPGRPGAHQQQVGAGRAGAGWGSTGGGGGGGALLLQPPCPPGPQLAPIRGGSAGLGLRERAALRRRCAPPPQVVRVCGGGHRQRRGHCCRAGGRPAAGRLLGLSLGPLGAGRWWGV